jgi:hypothetical protein
MKTEGEIAAQTVTLRLRLAANWKESIQILGRVGVKTYIHQFHLKTQPVSLAACPSGWGILE